MDDLAAPFRREAAVQSFKHQTGLNGDEAAAAGNAGGDLREEAVQTANHEIQPRAAFIHVVDGREDRLHAVVRVDTLMEETSCCMARSSSSEIVAWTAPNEPPSLSFRIASRCAFSEMFSVTTFNSSRS